MSKTNDFLESHKENMEVLGFWGEVQKSTILFHMECMYKREVIAKYGISDIVINKDDVVLLKWHKRPIPLSEEQLDKRYGKSNK